LLVQVLLLYDYDWVGNGDIRQQHNVMHSAQLAFVYFYIVCFFVHNKLTELLIV